MTLKPILSAVLALVVCREDPPGSPEKRAQLVAVGSAVAEFAKTPDEAAFLIAWAQAESHLSLRIHIGNCKPWECDRGRARGPWQTHRNGMPEERWARMIGVENTRAQAEQAARHARWAMRQCPDRVLGAFRVLGGNGCDRPIKGERDRVAAFQRVRAKL
ncbi:MAG TPA: hypothetical protein VGK73_32715 [Polyangiaceae bacterium]